MRTIIVLASVACIFFLSVTFEARSTSQNDMVMKIYSWTKSLNTVTGVYLNTRLYDTIFEILVFSLATIGVKTYAGSLREVSMRLHISDPAATRGIKLLAFLSFLIGFYLSVFGHLSPGGGFAGGVAGGTGLLLIAITSGFDELENHLIKRKIHELEKLTLFLILSTAFIDFLGVPFLKSSHPLLDAGYIVLYNVLIFLKVTIGSWVILYNFIRHRGVL